MNWQPIDTLPDAVNEMASRRVLVYFPHIIGDNVQVMSIANVTRLLHSGPTHWQFLPEPPEEPTR